MQRESFRNSIPESLNSVFIVLKTKLSYIRELIQKHESSSPSGQRLSETKPGTTTVLLWSNKKAEDIGYLVYKLDTTTKVGLTTKSNPSGKTRPKNSSNHFCIYIYICHRKTIEFVCVKTTTAGKLNLRSTGCCDTICIICIPICKMLCCNNDAHIQNEF